MIKGINISGFYRKIGAMSASRYAAIGSALIVAMILTRLLDEDVYGQYRKLWLIYAILGPAFINSIANTLYYRGTSGNRDAAISANMVLGLIYGIGTGAVAWLFAPFWASQLNVTELVNGFRMFAPYMALAVFAGIAEPLFINLNRKKWLVFYSFSYNLVEMALIVVPFAMGLPIEQVVLIMSIGPALRSAFILVLALKSMQTIPGFREIRLEIPSSFKYGMGILVISITGMAAAEADKWVVGSFFESDALYAIYVIGAKKIPFIMALTGAVSATIVSEYAAKMKNGEFGEAVKEISRASTRLSLMLIPLVAFLFVYAEEVMILLFDKYEASAPIFRVYMLTILTQLVFPQSIILGAGRSDVNAKFGIAELFINLSLSITLVMWIGLLGPAFATLAAHLAFTIFMFWFCYKKYGINPTSILPGRKTALLLVSLPIVLFSGWFLKSWLGVGWAGFGITGIITAVMILITVRKA